MKPLACFTRGGAETADDHLSEEELRRFQDGRLSPAEWDRLAPHLDACPQCQTRLDGPDDVLAAIARQAPPPPPPVANYEYLLDGHGFAQVVGRGGAGVVFLARFRGLKDNPPRAVKVLHTGFEITRRSRERFLREIEAITDLGRQGHPGFVQIFECGEAGGCLYYVMEYLPGGNLRQRLREHPPTLEEAASWVHDLARTMVIAHGEGVIHRDLKPSNILLATEDAEPGAAPRVRQLKIADFSHARLLHRGSHLTHGEPVGTPNYMAPEQARGEPAEARADVYGLCAILYEMLTGRPPFDGPSGLATIELVRSPDRLPPAPATLCRLLRRGRGADLAGVCLKGLEKEPHRRYPSAAALADDLRRFLDGEPVRARTAGPLERGWRWCRRKPAVAGLLTLLALALAGGFGGVVYQLQQTEAARRDAVARERQATEARREAEANYDRLCALFDVCSRVNNYSLRPGGHDAMAAIYGEAVRSLDFLLERRDHQPELRVLLAMSLTQAGAANVHRHQDETALAYLERAAREWEQLPVHAAGKTDARTWRAVTSAYLERVYERNGTPQLARRAFDNAFLIWQDLAREDPASPLWSNIAGCRQVVASALVGGSPEGVRAGRARQIRARLKSMGREAEFDLLLGMAQVSEFVAEGAKHEAAGQRAAALAAAREAAFVIDKLLSQPRVHRKTRCQLNYMTQSVTSLLRRSGAPEEALTLCEHATRALQELAPEASAEFPYQQLLAQSWIHVAKARWALKQPEETLGAYRNAIAAQRLAFGLAPAAARDDLGTYFACLGRKMCELGRLDEAEAAFREKQALWPGDPTKHEDALRELRKWAGEVGHGRDHLSPEARQQRQRYLELCARLEGQGDGPAQP